MWYLNDLMIFILKCGFCVTLAPRLYPRKCLDFNWKMFHGRLSTETQLKRMWLPEGICFICKKEQENVDHLLIKCTDLCEIWKHVGGIISHFSVRNYIYVNSNIRIVVVWNDSNNV